jgi:taurine dioxygenase/alpha-ketoglutarate-dependent 2,4-dichlorophenoxyacetate dioxygenase
MSKITISPINELFAARIEGVDVANPMIDEVFDEVHQAFDKYGVLIFPDQRISADEQQAFAERFGELESFPEASMQKKTPKVYNISNISESGDLLGKESVQARMLKGTELWHTDSSYRDVPALASFLFALEIPDSSETGGQTEFSDMISAYEDLPKTLLEKLNGRHMVHNYEYERLYVDTELPPMSLDEKLNVPPVTHPVIRFHPHNGKCSVYITSNVGDVIGGYGYEEGRALHRELLDFVTQRKYVYQHQWLPHDLVVWDNRRTMHRVIPYDIDKQPRVMQRTTVSDVGPPVAPWMNKHSHTL